MNTIEVCGRNDDFRINEESNNKTAAGENIICPAMELNLDASLISTYSTYNKTVMVTNDGIAQGIGDNSDGQISNSLPNKYLYNFTKIDIKDRNGQSCSVISAICGRNYTLYLISAGPKNEEKQLAYAHSNINTKYPVILNIGDLIPVSIFGGWSDCAAIDSNGSIIYINGTLYKLPSMQLKPISLPDNEKAYSVVCCRDYIIALSSNGQIYESSISELSFRNIYYKYIDSFIHISGVFMHCFAVNKDGKVFVKGRDFGDYGFLGLGKNIKDATWSVISSLSKYKISAAYAGYSHSLFQTQNGEILACGDNRYGQLQLKSGLNEEIIFQPVETMITNASFCIAGCFTTIIFKKTNHPINQKKIIDSKKLTKRKSFIKPKISQIDDSKSENESDSNSDDFLCETIYNPKISPPKISHISDSKSKISPHETRNISDSKSEIASSKESSASVHKSKISPPKISTISDSKSEIATLKQKISQLEKQLSNKDKELKKQQENFEKEISKYTQIASKNDIKSTEKVNDDDEKHELSFLGSEDEDNFELIEKVGEGMTSIVYKMIDKRTLIPLCKKVLKTEGASFKDMQNAAKEFEVLHSLHHPCICSAIAMNTLENVTNDESGDEKETTTIAIFLEFIDYKLKDCLEMNIINNTLKTRIILEIAHGIRYLHSKRMIYRDLKLSNIMLNSIFQVKMIDFGLVKVNEYLFGEEMMSSISMAKGAFEDVFMSPEMLKDEDIDCKTDVYSFGILLYYLFTGKLPEQSLKERLMDKPIDIPRPSSSISKCCIELISECLSTNSKDRPSFNDILIFLRDNKYMLAPDVDPSIISQRDKELELYK